MQKHNSIHFTTDYKKVLERMNTIDPIKYAKTRNFLNGHITYLAPYISRGVISVKQVLANIVNNGFAVKDAEKLIQELAWREYYQRIWQSKNDLIWQDLKQDQDHVVHHNMIAALHSAQTGIEIIDAAIHQLYQSGYLHNHIRMYVASIACNIGQAYWLEPSKWMYYHLLDGDIASNNCSWQWVAGAFASKKYYCNQENINKYTNTQQTNTFLDKPYASLVNMPIPLSLQATATLHLSTQLPKTAQPNIDIRIPTLIYNSYNLDPEWRKDENVNRVLLLEPSHFNRYPVSENLLQFMIGLASNIKGLQVYTGEVEDIKKWYEPTNDQANHNVQYQAQSQSQGPFHLQTQEMIIAKEHPAFNHYPGTKDARDWMFESVTGFYPSFFSYWKKCARHLNF
jgi:deoxyribodipyrimidine photo-lyase